MDDLKKFISEQSTIKPSDSFEREFAYYCYDYIKSLDYADRFSSTQSSNKIFYENLLRIIWYKYLKIFKEFTDRSFWGGHILEDSYKDEVYNIKPLIELDLNFSLRYDELLFNSSSQNDLDELIRSTILSEKYSSVISDLEKVYGLNSLSKYYSQFYSFHYNIAKGNYSSASKFASLPYTRIGVFDNNNSVRWHLGLLSKGLKYPLDHKIFETLRYADMRKTKFYKNNLNHINDEFDRLMDEYYDKFGNNFIGVILREFLEVLPEISSKKGIKSFLKRLNRFDIKTDFRKDDNFYDVDDDIKKANSLSDFYFNSASFKFDLPIKDRVKSESTKEFTIPTGLPRFMYFSLIDENINYYMIKAENIVRSESNHYKVGERWENETRVFKELNKKLPQNCTIFREYEIWADGSKRLDFFIPDHKLAIEYNGIQHYKAIDFFGGKSGLKRTKESDKRKEKYCQEKGIKLFVIRYNDDISKRIREIINYLENN